MAGPSYTKRPAEDDRTTEDCQVEKDLVSATEHCYVN